MLVWRRLASAKWADAWEERLVGPARGRMAIHTLPGGRSIRIEIYDVTAAEGRRLRREFGGSLARVARDGWVAVAGRTLKPLAIRGSLLVVHDEETFRLERESSRLGRSILLIPSGVAFGTGDHATTASCLRMLADEAARLPPGSWRMLDVGTGTGILALAARLLGARAARGFDHDPMAVRTARANARANGLRQVVFEQATLGGDGFGERDEPCEVVAANVFSEALIAAAPVLAQAVRPGGLLIVSGILRQQEQETLSALARQRTLAIESITRRGKWIAAGLRAGA